MNHPINLIINADDLGAGDPTDQGIIEAFTKGIVTSASLLANGPSFNLAAEMARRVGLPVGVHLNISEGFSLTGPIAGATDTSGQFLGKVESRRRFIAGDIDNVLLKNEFIAQIDKVRDSGLQPDHLDTHQHSGLFPVVTTALISAAQDSGIISMRLSSPVQPDTEDPPPPLGDEMRLYRHLAPVMTEQLTGAGIKTPSGLLGMPLLDRLDENHLSNLLSHLTPGTLELMVHPGYFDPDRAFSGEERELELNALTSKNILALIQRQGIRLISFKDLPCAC